ncbi:unnamed protein product [Phytophthora fragariaefolia]|uniref:Unnamed protein product n=1 Tax=Phytophthora fragariaefolia TaxID=1490495 RepID=A0A9W6TXW1_9STRA|nr:unnamed protein product [Phytophthora fragariaefolia]
MEQLDSVCLSSKFRLASGEGTVTFEQMVGMLARDSMLSDTLIDFSIRCICNTLKDCFALDSFAVTLRCPDPPATRISSIHYVVLPVHLSNIHWGVIIVGIAYKRETPTFTPYYYEPLCISSYSATLEATFEKTVIPFLRDWHNKTMSGMKYPVEEEGVWLKAPKQPNGTSCGVMIIAQVQSVLKDSFRFSKTTVTADDIAVMRLRIMWMIVMQLEVSTVANKLAAAVDATDLELMATRKF